MRRVLFILPALRMGGMEKQLITVLEATRGMLDQHEVEIVTFLPDSHTNIVDRLRDLSIPVTTIDRTSAKFPSFLWKLVRHIRARKPHIVHTFLAGSTGTWGRLAARLAGVPTVILSDLALDPMMTRTQVLLDPFLNLLTTRFITNAETTAQRLRRSGVPAKKIRILRNAIDLDLYNGDFDRGLRREWGVHDEGVVVGYLGMLRPEKRPQLLLDAVQHLPVDARPDKVVLAGDGPLMAQIKARVENDEWLSRHCVLTGVIDDVPTFLANIDVMVLTSDTESLPNAVIEAMAAGVPCIATDVADVPFLIQDRRFLVKPGDASDMADALSRMLDLAPEARRQFGLELRIRAAAEFDLAASSERFWSLHQDLWPKQLGRALT